MADRNDWFVWLLYMWPAWVKPGISQWSSCKDLYNETSEDSVASHSSNVKLCTRCTRMMMEHDIKLSTGAHQSKTIPLYRGGIVEYRDCTTVI